MSNLVYHNLPINPTPTHTPHSKAVISAISGEKNRSFSSTKSLSPATISAPKPMYNSCTDVDTPDPNF